MGKDHPVLTTQRQLERAQARKLEQMHRRLVARIRVPTMPIYDPEFPIDAVNGEHALQAGVPYYFWDGTWYPFDAPAPPGPSASGSATWLVGGYQGLIHFDTTLLNYYRFTNVGGASYLKDWYGGGLPTDLVNHVGVAADIAITYGFAPPPTLDIDDTCARLTATNPNNASLDSHSDYLTPSGGGGNLAKWGVATVDTFSWECWFKPDPTAATIAAGHGQFCPLISGWSQTSLTTKGLHLSMDLSSGGATPTLTVRSANGAAISSAAFGAGGWHHVVLTCDAGKLTLYLDGVVVGRDTTHLSDSQGPNDWIIGGAQFYNGAGAGNTFWRSFQGDIAEIAMYKSVLSPSEVLLHYNGSGPSTDTGRWITIPFGSGGLIGPSSVDTAELADLAVTTAKLADLAVTTAKLADSSVNSTKILDGTIAAIDISAALKPSGTAADTTEALRALGTTAGKATTGKTGRAARATPTYSASITPDSSAGAWQTIVATNGTAFTINAPSNAPASTETQEMTIEISNTSGGALGAVTWNGAFVFTNGAFVAPATGMKRSVTFGWNGTVWVELSRAAADY